MAIRWKKNPAPTGLARVCSGPPGSTLRIDGRIRVATVRTFSGPRGSGWYWVAGWGHPSIPSVNTCNEPLNSEAEAKHAAETYVRRHLEAAKNQGHKGGDKE